MKSSRTRILLYTGLALLMVGLFAAIYRLNSRQHQISLTNLEIAMGKSNAQEAALLREQIERAESQAYALFGTDRMFEVDLFRVHAGSILPACAAGIAGHSVSKEEANTAFSEGIALLPSAAALPYFEKAARAQVDADVDLYQKISALFNVLDFRKDPLIACEILLLTKQNHGSLSEARKDFFLAMLTEHFPELDYMETRLNELLKTAERLNQKINVKKGAFRASLGDELFSVRKDGLTVLLKPDFKTTAMGEISLTPTVISKEIVPGFYLTVSDEVFSEERRRVDKQYHSGNIVLSLLALLATFLAIGLAATSRHQRKLNAARTQFIATVSHELRTPLSLIHLHAETLSHGRVPEGKVDDYHQTILNEAERLTGIVNNVLDFSRMERNKLNIHLEPTDVSALTEHIADTFRDRLHQEGVALERNIAKDVMGPVDPIAFSQIVLNLLDNAIKYSDDAKRIRIALDVSKDWNILTVADQGIGIPKALKKHIFNEFVRSDDRKVTARRGSGIGLSVTKRLVEKMNGTIDVADNEPNGSIFTVRLKGDDETPGG